MGCRRSVGANRNEETGAERIDGSPRGAECGRREAPRPGPLLDKQRGHLLEQASPGKTTQRLSLMSVLCTCFCGTTAVVQGRVELCVTCAGCCWGKQSSKNVHGNSRALAVPTAPRLRVWKKKKASEPKNGKRGKSLNTHASPRGQCTDGNMQFLEGKVCRLPGSVCLLGGTRSMARC